jgi:hypothetical protein
MLLGILEVEMPHLLHQPQLSQPEDLLLLLLVDLPLPPLVLLPLLKLVLLLLIPTLCLLL